MLLNTTDHAERSMVKLCLAATVTLQMVILLIDVTGRDLLLDTGKRNFDGSSVATLPFVRMSPTKMEAE